MLSLVIWIPAASALIGATAGGRRTPGALALLGSLASLGLAIALIAGWSGHLGQLTHVTDVVWIRSLGIHYKLGLDGLNLFLVALTTFVFSLALIAANLREWPRTELFYLLLGIAQSAVLGAFLAQDLALFIGFFDLMLIPFYLLTGIYGGPGRVAAS
jgi:NADH-quinone oxidoreductase subunit M